MTKIKNLVGNVYSALTVIENVGHKIGYLCLCECGNICFRKPYSLELGKTRSCGCWRKTMGHNQTNSPTYRSWRGMRDRCYKKDHHQYKNYGARGITVCEEWRVSFVNFFNDMGIRPIGKTLDRKNINGNYSKENCRWATNVEQQNNKRNSFMITYQDKTMTLTEWCRLLGLNSSTIWCRVTRSGYSIKDAFEVEVKNKHNVTYKGVTKSLGEWGKEIGIRGNVIGRRLKRGWSIEEAVTTLIMKNKYV